MAYEEKILEDNYPVYLGHWYIIEVGEEVEPTRSCLTGTVEELRKEIRYVNELSDNKEIIIKSCDIVGRRLPE